MTTFLNGRDHGEERRSKITICLSRGTKGRINLSCSMSSHHTDETVIPLGKEELASYRIGLA